MLRSWRCFVKYSRYPSYKDSGVEWLGEVPQTWATMQFRRITSLQQGLQIPQENRFAEGDSSKLEYITIKALNAGSQREHKEYIESPSIRVQCSKEDVLLARTGATGEVVTNVKGVFHNNFFKVNYDKKKIFKNYLVYLLKAKELKNHLLMLAGTTTIPDLNHGAFLGTTIPLPLLKQQQTIVNYLDKATAKIDTLIEKQTKLIELLKEKRQAVISHAVTKGLDPNVKMKDSGVEWLGEVPGHWGVKKLKYNLVLQVNKVSIDKQQVIALENIAGWSGKFIETDSEYKGNDVTFEKNDILFGKLRPYLAKVYKTTNTGVAFGDILVYRPNKDTVSQFAFYSVISEAFINIVDGSTYGSKMPRASVEFVSNMPISIPPKLEQQSIADYLDNKTSKIDTLIEKANQGIALLKERRIALISAAVTGKIDVRGNSQ